VFRNVCNVLQTNIPALLIPSAGPVLRYPDNCPVGKFGGVFHPMAEIRVQEGEPLENALRRFKRKVQTEDIIKEVKRHSFYLKPGEKKRVKEALARKRNRKKIRKEQD
jgi:small subunit ribosomal protein S21